MFMYDPIVHAPMVTIRSVDRDGQEVLLSFLSCELEE